MIEFTGDTMNDLAIAVIAGFNWLNHCAGLAGADRKQFSGTLNHFRRIAITAQKWWEMEGAKERYAQMLQAQHEPPLLLYLVWADYGRLASEIAADAQGKERGARFGLLAWTGALARITPSARRAAARRNPPSPRSGWCRHATGRA